MKIKKVKTAYQQFKEQNNFLFFKNLLLLIHYLKGQLLNIAFGPKNIVQI